MNNQLVEVISKNHVEESTAKSLQNAFSHYFVDAQRWADKAKTIIVSDVSQTDLMTQAREARLCLKTIRVETEKTRKHLKEDGLRKGKAIDGIANVIKYLIIPIEEHLEKQEKFAEHLEAEKKEKLITSRAVELSKYMEFVEGYDLGNMPEPAYLQLLDGAKITFQKKLDEEKRIQEEIVAKQKAEAAEREHIKQENIKLQKEKEAAEKLAKKEAAEKAKLQAEIKAREEKAEVEKQVRVQAEKERIAKEEEESKKLVQELADEKAAILAEQQASIKKAAKEKERLEASIKAKEKAEKERIQAEAEKAEAERQAAEKAVEEEKARIDYESKRPDREKIFVYANSIESITLPGIASEEIKKEISKHITDFVYKIKGLAEKL